MRRSALVSLALTALVAAQAAADINLELRPADQFVPNTGQTVSLGLYAVSDDPRDSQLLAAIQVVLSWDPAYLDLTGLSGSGAVSLLVSSFPVPDPHGLNEAAPPGDGDGFYLALAPLGSPVAATPAGTLITTFQFTAIQNTALTSVLMLESAGSPPGETIVFDGSVPNLDVTGTLQGADVSIGKQPCPADVNGDGEVDVQDLVLVILAWDSANPAADVNDDGVVAVEDLVAVIIAWGLCP